LFEIVMDKIVMNDQERGLLEYLRSSLPTADQIVLSDEQLLQVVRHVLAVRDEVPWGKDIPEGIFRAFVAFPRINNEDPVFYHGPIWEALKERIKGKTMYEAVIEINYWTCEVATYQSTDGRTANALIVITRAYGRCGEESVLLVSALRAAGIPARQVYVPRWAHCDDNHAWVEAWVDGRWYYLGACEPEPVLDSGWFTAAASKAMLVHTRSYGLDPEGDRIENHIGNAAIINRTEGYADTVLFTVKVTEKGQPMEGANVRFELVNGSDFFPINDQYTDSEGKVDLLTGKGGLRVHVTDGKRYVARMVDLSQTDACEISFDEAVDFERGTECYRQQPPLETRIQPVEFTEEVASVHKLRAANCESTRAAREATFSTENSYYTNARGNHAELDRFMADGRYTLEDKNALLDTLREKDFVDFKAETLTDALDAALPHKEKYPFEVWQKGVLNPRIAIEMMYPVRAWFKENMTVEANAQAIWQYLTENIELCEMEPVTLIPDLRAVWTARKASTLVLDVLYVAVCRAFGVAARLSPASREKEYYDGEWKALMPGRQSDAKLVLVNKSDRELYFYAHFTVARLENGVFQPLMLFGTQVKDRVEIPVMSGCYRVTTATRQIDGSVDGYLIPVEVAAGESAEVELIMADDRTEEMQKDAKLPELTTQGHSLPEAGVPAIVALLDPGAEPSEHFLNELLEVKDELAAASLKVSLMIEEAEDAANEKLQLVLAELKNVELLIAPDVHTLTQWRQMLNAGDRRLPLALAIDEKGVGLFAYTNYNVGSVRSLMQILLGK